MSDPWGNEIKVIKVGVPGPAGPPTLTPGALIAQPGDLIQGGGGGAPEVLRGAANNQILTFNGATGKWEPRAPAAPAAHTHRALVPIEARRLGNSTLTVAAATTATLAEASFTLESGVTYDIDVTVMTQFWSAVEEDETELYLELRSGGGATLLATSGETEQRWAEGFALGNALVWLGVAGNGILDDFRLRVRGAANGPTGSASCRWLSLSGAAHPRG